MNPTEQTGGHTPDLRAQIRCVHDAANCLEKDIARMTDAPELKRNLLRDDVETLRAAANTLSQFAKAGVEIRRLASLLGIKLE